MSEDDEIGREAASRMLDRIGGDPDVPEEIAACIKRYDGTVRGVDVWAVEFEGLTAAEWARMTDRDRSTVSRNVRRAKQEDAKRRQEDTADE